MKLLSLLLTTFVMLVGCSVIDPNVELQNQQFRELVAQVKQQSPEADFFNLRMAYTNTSAYDPYGYRGQLEIEKAFEEFEKEDYEGCVKQVNRILDLTFISLDAHYLGMVCHLELNNEQQAEFHQYVLSGLFASISSTGNGRTFESAYITISIGELRTFIGMLGLEVKEQGLQYHKGKTYDVMTVREVEIEEEFDLYFDISIQMEKGYAN